MSKRTYRTAQGKVVDLGALQMKNENVRAVGNMSVNAKGDLLDANNQSIQARNQQVSNQYRKQVKTNVSDDAVLSSRRAKSDVQPTEMPAAVVKDTKLDNNAETATIESTADDAGGLAAAIAKARAVRQEPLKTARQASQEKSGVKKI